MVNIERKLMNSSYSGGPIVVGVDGSRAALDAVRLAVAEAQELHSAVRLVHVISPHPQPETVYGAPDVDGDYGRTVLREAVHAAAEIDSSVLVETVVLHGQPESAILAEAKSARLLVLGISQGHALTARVLRSTVFTLVESSVCPVLIVRECSTGSDGAVVVALGDAEVLESDVVVAEAFREASSRKTDVLAIHTRSISEVVAHVIGGANTNVAPETPMDARLESFRADYPTVRSSTVYAEAGSGSELVAVSGTARLLVVGHERGRTCGSTLTTVLRRAECPVLVVPHA